MRLVAFCLTALLVVSLTADADWRSFRGSATNSLAPEEQIPLDWESDDVVAWSAELPGRGLSCPIVVGDKVVVTASSGYRQGQLHVLCFAAVGGELLWERTFWATGRTSSHPKTCVAAPTPSSDGERIFATYSSNDVACLDLEGNLLWYRGLTYDYPNASNSLGMSSSSVVVGGSLVVMVENDIDSFTTGLDTRTGEELWRIDRPQAANWTSPALWSHDGEDLVLLQSSAGVTAVDPVTGETRWSYGDGASTVPSLVASDGVAYVPSNGLTAIRPGQNTPEVAEIVWQEGGLSPGTSSPLVFDDSVFVLSRPNVLIRAEAGTGEEQWKLRLSGNFSSTPVVAAGHLICFNEEGTAFVVDPAESGRIVSTREFGETILATPAVADDALYIRSDAHLWKIAAP